MQITPASYVFSWKKNRQSSIFHLLIFTLLLLVVTGPFIWLVYQGLLRPKDLLKIASEISLPLFPTLACIAVIAFDLIKAAFYRAAKLHIDESGVRLKLPPGSGLAIVNFLERELLWSDLKDASYMKRLQLIQLRPTYAASPLSIDVKDWQLQNKNADLNSGNAEPDLLKVFRELAILEKFPKNTQLEASDFDLLKHSATRMVLLAMAVLATYSFVDVLLQHEEYAFFNFSYFLPHIVSGLAVVVILVFLMIKASKPDVIPRSIVVGLALLSGVIFGFSSYIGGIRINQIAGGSLLEARYHRDANCMNLLPEDKDLPVVKYHQPSRAYWCSKRMDEALTVKVRKGWFGLYQFDLREHNEAIRSYQQKS
ncbi:hypothetical protein ACO0LC_07835 [Undibacterium sp. JH2W]|uniref:hypothetical protein n=1 Tax=Undibacterium sp. JH2W TaxID=3413037 RepID=UPI003BF25E42